MFRTQVFRAGLRIQKANVRQASTKSAQETAQQALSVAQKQAEKALEVSKQVGGRVGERVGGWLRRDGIAYREPVTYNLAVARAFLRQVYVAEGLAPPTSVEAFTSAYRTLLERAKNPAYWREIAQSGEWAKVALYGVEAYGIFHIGEITGCDFQVNASKGVSREYPAPLLPHVARVSLHGQGSSVRFPASGDGELGVVKIPYSTYGLHVRIRRSEAHGPVR
ncbi:ATP synthase g subunit domain-containing protein [Rhizoctonia solani AG-1 IA]|uniref:ATP synthase g subunit domain-containing protein n=1 Tax=Thanatephorus cucumeris (strain AG1-IA) TaxID=983506 RepID=L8WQH2_THACA|nr:ATP synthase g subunit domain-containing protein [Rhizoctonia solani AG-1 IA]